MRTPRLAVLALLAVVAVGGCGRKGSPIPPPSRVPTEVQDLTVEQRGPEMLFGFTFPTLTVGGLPLSGVERVEVWEAAIAWVPPPPRPEGEEMTEAIPERPDAPQAETPDDTWTEAPVDDPWGETPDDPWDAAEPAPPDGPVDPEDPEAVQPSPSAQPADPSLPSLPRPVFRSRAVQIAALEGQALRGAIVGSRIAFTLPRHLLRPVPEMDAAEPTPGGNDVDPTPRAAPRDAHFLAVRVVSAERRTSDFSNLALLMPKAPPPPPGGVALTPLETGIRVDWGAPPGVELEGIAIFRRGEAETRFGGPLAVVVPERRDYLDESAVLGQRYVYAVASVAQLAPRVTSVLSDDVEIEYQDVFPPAPPVRLATFPERGRVRLLWEASTSRDVVGYHLERRSEDGEFRVISGERPLSGLEYVDTDVVSAASYVYRVVAVDRSGNVSEPSAEATVRIP